MIVYCLNPFWTLLIPLSALLHKVLLLKYVQVLPPNPQHTQQFNNISSVLLDFVVIFKIYSHHWSITCIERVPGILQTGCDIHLSWQGTAVESRNTGLDAWRQSQNISGLSTPVSQNCGLSADTPSLIKSIFTHHLTSHIIHTSLVGQ